MKTESDEMVQEILLYYTGDCTTDNTIVDTIILAQNVALEFIKAALPALSRVSFNFPSFSASLNYCAIYAGLR